MGEHEKEEKIEVPRWLSKLDYHSLESDQLLVMELLEDDSVSKETAIKILYLAGDC